MAGYKIAGQPGLLRIDVVGVAGKEQRLMASLRECKEGHCSCPTPEYDKVASMNIAPNDGTIRIDLKTKPGSTLHEDAVAKCLDFTLAQLTTEEL